MTPKTTVITFTILNLIAAGVFYFLTADFIRQLWELNLQFYAQTNF